MTYLISTSHLAFTLLLLSFCVPSLSLADDALLRKKLSAEELRQRFINQTVETESADGKVQKLLYFGKNGNLEQVVKNRLSTGHWKIRKNGRLCTSIGSQKNKCRAVVSKTNQLIQFVIKKDGKHRHELTYTTFHPGNKIRRLNKSPLLPENTLTSRQLKKLFSDKTVESVTVKNKRVSRTFYAPNGAVEQTRNGVLRTGNWQVKNSRICIQMEALKKKCRIIVKEGNAYNKYIVKKNGRHQHTVSYIKFIRGKHL